MVRESDSFILPWYGPSVSVREISENTMFLVGGAGEGGGARVGLWGRKVSEKRRFVVCAPMVVPTHGPHPDGRTDLRGFGCDVCATASRGRLTPV